MKVYIAGRVDDITKVQSIQDEVIAAGHEITFDWTREPDLRPYAEQQLAAEKMAVDAITGIQQCDVFVLLTCENGGKAMYMELGAALMQAATGDKPKIYVIGDYVGNSVFYFHPLVKRRALIKEVLRELSSSSD